MGDMTDFCGLTFLHCCPTSLVCVQYQHSWAVIILTMLCMCTCLVGCHTVMVLVHASRAGFRVNSHAVQIRRRTALQWGSKALDCCICSIRWGVL